MPTPRLLLVTLICIATSTATADDIPTGSLGTPTPPTTTERQESSGVGGLSKLPTRNLFPGSFPIQDTSTRGLSGLAPVTSIPSFHPGIRSTSKSNPGLRLGRRGRVGIPIPIWALPILIPLGIIGFVLKLTGKLSPRPSRMPRAFQGTAPSRPASPTAISSLIATHPPRGSDDH